MLVFYIQQYFNTSIKVLTKSGLEVTDCTVQSAEYWYGMGDDTEPCQTVLGATCLS